MDDPSLIAPIKNKIEHQIAGKVEIKDKEELPNSVDWSLVNQGAADWARNYSFDDLLPGINETTRIAMQSAIASFFAEGLTIGELEQRIAEILGPEKAEMIARTEVTRAAVEGERETVRETDKILAKHGIKPMVEVWQTRNDELVCPICRSRHGKKRGDGWTKEDGPPAHTGCRCWTNHKLPKKRE